MNGERPAADAPPIGEGRPAAAGSPDGEDDEPEIEIFAGPDRPEEIAAALRGIIEGAADAAAQAERLLQMGDAAAREVAVHLPGPLRRDLPREGMLPSLAEQGPLLALVPRFGRTIVPHLLRLIDSLSPEVRLYVGFAFSELRVPEAVQPLGTRLFDIATSVRRMAAASLARFEPSTPLVDLVDYLRNELLGPDATRQRFAAEAIGELRDPKSVPRLIELVKHHDAEVVEAAQRALLLITKQDFKTSRWRWRSWWEKSRGDSRIDWMLAGLTHPEVHVRQSASDELETITNGYFGYHFSLPLRQREEARQKWLAWYKQNGPRAAKELG